MGLSRPGTIQHALSLPEGSSVCLDAVIVDSVSAESFVVREWWDAGTRISVKLTPPAVLAVRQTVDVEGVTGIGPAILKPRVLGYLDRNGNLLLDPPVVKTPVAPVSWPWKADLTTLSADRAKAELSQPESLGAMAAEEGTIAWAKTLSVGSPLSTPLSGKVVTAGTGQFSGSIYIEEPDRSAGIRVATTSLREPGDIVDVSEGTVGELDGERFVAGATVDWQASGTPLRPIGMINRNLGGGDVRDGEGIIRQKGVTVLKTPNERVTSPDLNNIGLLVKTTGRITARITQGSREYIYIDDGSALTDGSGETGVRVEVGHLADGNEIWLPPGEDQYVIVTGISACTLLGGQVVRLLRPRSSDDILFRDLASQSWPMFMHDAHHSGRTWADDTASSRTLYLRWVAHVPTAATDLSRYTDIYEWGDFPHHSGGQTSPVTHPIFDSSPVYYAWGDPEDGTVLVGTYTGYYLDTVPEPDGRTIPYPTLSTGRLLAFNPLTLPTSEGEPDPGGEIDPVWKFPADSDPPVGGIASAPAVAQVGGQTLVIFGCEGDGSGTGSGRVYAVYANGESRGTAKWVYPAEPSDVIGKIMCSSPVVHDGVVYIGTESGELLALDADDGGLMFCTVLNTGITNADERKILGTSSPAVVSLNGEDYVFIGSDDGYLYKVGGAKHSDPGSQGKVLAQREFSQFGDRPCIESSPSYRGNIYVGSAYRNDLGTGKNVFCVDPTDLSLIWETRARNEVRATPALSGNGAYVGDETGSYFYAFHLQPSIEQRIAEVNTWDWVFGSAALTSALAFVGNDAGFLRAYDQLSLVNGLSLVRFNLRETRQWDALNSLGWWPAYYTCYSPWVSCGPALAYGVDGTEDLWLFITSRSTDSDGAAPGMLYCFGPEPPTD